jgi:hypothetical protein
VIGPDRDESWNLNAGNVVLLNIAHEPARSPHPPHPRRGGRRPEWLL